MSENDPDGRVVALAEDEQELADLYSAWLSGSYTVRTAYRGEEALERIDASVDVVLLDRRMPGMAGDEVLADLRDRGFAQPVAMVSAVEPDLDLLELNCSEYLSKPVRKDALQETVERLLALAELDRELRQYYELAAKKAALDQSLPRFETEESEAYASLAAEISTLREQSNTQDRLPDSLKSSLE